MADSEAHGHFSRLEASLAHLKIKPRQNSVEMKDVNRHTEAGDLNVNELDFDYSLDESNYPLNNLQSLQDVFSAIQHEKHLSDPKNFSDYTDIKCFDVGEEKTTWRTLDEDGLSALLQTSSSDREAKNSPSVKRRRLRVFFTPLIPTTGTSFGSRIMMTQKNTRELFSSLRVNPLSILNLLGRPDYWAPQARWESNETGDFEACDFFCQHPRWNLHFQGAPLSVYLRFQADTGQTTYIISHKENDTNIDALQKILKIAADTAPSGANSNIFLNEPFGIAVILSTLSFETSKYHVKRFQRFLWTEINKVDDHLAGLEGSDRKRLGQLTKQLQIISQNADSHLGNADVGILTADAILSSLRAFHSRTSSPRHHYERSIDSITYVIESLKKQKIWFLNYKNRKDGTMALVYNLVTQQDAASNIQLAESMKKDSTSMNAIAALTMVFLPGTFIATLLDAGSDNLRNGAIWWIWAAITVPLTIVVVACWSWYKVLKQKQPVAEKVTEEKEESKPIRPRLVSFGNISFSSSRKGSSMSSAA